MTDINEIVLLIRKDLRGDLTQEEAQQLQSWAATDPCYQQLLESVHDESWLAQELTTYAATREDTAATDRLLQAVRQGIQQPAAVPVIQPWYAGYKKWMAAAAAVLVLTVAGWLLQNKEAATPATVITVSDIKPGSNRATLILANGEQVQLDTTADGIIANSRQVMYADSSLAAVAAPVTGDRSWNTLSTPQGGQYSIVLPDGSKVWLNALTKLRYPTAFAEEGRVVELEGEAYFDVAHQVNATGQLLSFVVRSKGQEVQVLGTSFNINAYADEREVRTTLVNGSVQIRNLYTGGATKLEPGQHSEVNPDVTTVHKADVFSATAWKEGLFSFRNAGVEDLMKQLRRWYGVEVSFEGAIPTMSINGEVDRNMPATKVFEVLDYLDIAFRIDNNRIIISNKK